MTDCAKCHQPLTPGNIKVVRRAGKRPRRVHRKCPAKQRTETVSSLGACSPEECEQARPTESAQARFYISRVDVDRLKSWRAGFGVSVTVFAIEDWQVEQDPEQFAHLVEIRIG